MSFDDNSLTENEKLFVDAEVKRHSLEANVFGIYISALLAGLTVFFGYLSLSLYLDHGPWWIFAIFVAFMLLILVPLLWSLVQKAQWTGYQVSILEGEHHWGTGADKMRYDTIGGIKIRVPNHWLATLTANTSPNIRARVATPYRDEKANSDKSFGVNYLVELENGPSAQLELSYSLVVPVISPILVLVTTLVGIGAFVISFVVIGMTSDGLEVESQYWALAAILDIMFVIFALKCYSAISKAGEVITKLKEIYDGANRNFETKGSIWKNIKKRYRL